VHCVDDEIFDGCSAMSNALGVTAEGRPAGPQA